MFVKVKITTESKREKIEKISEDSFHVSVCQKPEQNMANARLLTLMSEYFGIPRNLIHIISGHKNRSKILEIVQ